MQLQIQSDSIKRDKRAINHSSLNDSVFSKDYVDFLNEAGWILEKKLPSNINHYSDLLEDTDWDSSHSNINTPKHYRRDLDALS
tara:strand:- start:669 stop:920 length:252 start_codon:yes stop_codon:yes gene_type:complete